MSYQVDSYGNAYFPAGVSVASIPATTGTQNKVLVPGPNGRISSASISQLITQSGGNLVSSIFGRTGVITALRGDYNTDQVTEGQALYFSDSRARKAITLTTFNTSGPATYDSSTGIINIPQYGSGTSSPTNFVPLTRTISINGQTADLSVDRAFSVDTIPYPSLGIPLSNGTSWGESITNNSANWNTAFGWGNHAGLYSLLDHTHTFASLTSKPTTLAGYGITDAATSAQGANADTAFGWGNHALAGYLTSFTEADPIWTADKPNYALKTYVDTSISNLIDTAPSTLNTLNELAAALGDDANFSTTITTLIGTKEPAITAGTTAQYWRGDKTWQTLPIYTLAGLGGVPTTRTLTINSVAYDLSENRTWTITAGISSVSGTAPISVSTVAGAATVSIATANTTTTGALSSTDWNTFNNKQNALTNPVTGTGTNNYVAKFTSTGSTIGNSQIYDNGTNIGLFHDEPLYELHILKSVVNVELVTESKDTNRYATNNVLTDVSGASIASFGSNYPESGGSKWAGRSGLYINTGRPNQTLNLWIGTRTIINSLNNGKTAIGQSDPLAWLDVQGNLMVRTVANSTGDFLTISADNIISRRTTAELFSDIGAASLSSLSNYLPLAGGIMTGAITLKEGATNGLKFPNDVFGGSGDTAGMRLIARSGEAMSLEVYLTNDADDWFNIVVPNTNGAKVNGNTIWHAGNLTNLNQLTNGPGYITSYTDTNTTYSITIPASTTKIRLSGSDASTSDITFTGSGATTITRTSATEFTISSTDTDTNTTYANFTRTVAGLVPNPGGTTTNRYLREDGTWVIPPDTDTDTNTWDANTKTVAGYVAAPGAVANKVWKTDATGNPAWRDDADTVYSLPIASATVLGGIKVGTNLSIDTNGLLSSTDTNTWNANTKDIAGYVAAPGAVANKVWKTDASGNPGWRDDADTDTNTTYTAGTGLTLTGTSFSVTKTITASETADTIALRNGSGQLVATGFFQASSRELKTNITPFTRSALDIIREVAVVSFNYKTDVINKHIGFIAEDTPEELSTRNKNVMDSNNTIGVLLKAIQELESKVKELEAKCNEK